MTTTPPAASLRNSHVLFPQSETATHPRRTPGEAAFQRAGISLGLMLIGVQIPAAVAGQAPINLRSAAHFTILAGAAITTTGGGVINGDVGASPIAGAAIALTQEQVNGTIYAVDASGPAGSVIDPALLLAAKGDLTTAYNDAAGRTPVPSGPFLNPGAGNLGGLILIPGLYKFTGTALITGASVTLTGGPDDVWIFQIASDLQVGSSIQVVLAGGAQARNVFWQVGTSVAIGTFATFKGTIMSNQAIVMNTSSTLEGRALAFTAGVTYNGNGGTLPVPEQPKFTEISRDQAGAISLVVRTTPYCPLVLETTTDLLLPASWTTIATDIPQTDTWGFIHDAAGATGPRRFYRAKISAY
jgi:Ice-binding-like